VAQIWMHPPGDLTPHQVPEEEMTLRQATGWLHCEPPAPRQPPGGAAAVSRPSAAGPSSPPPPAGPPGAGAPAAGSGLSPEVANAKRVGRRDARHGR